jgi:hypothetical protein
MVMVTRVLLASVLFYLVSNPSTYKLVDSVLSRFVKIISNGSPTSYGLLIHTAVFALLFWILSPMTSGQEGDKVADSAPEVIKSQIQKVINDKNIDPATGSAIQQMMLLNAKKDITPEDRAKAAKEIRSIFINAGLKAQQDKAKKALEHDKKVVEAAINKQTLEPNPPKSDPSTSSNTNGSELDIVEIK